MDDLPIGISKKLLIQVGAVVRPTGWRQEPATGKTQDGKGTLEGWRVVDSGKMPWQVKNTEVTLTIANIGLKKATLLDTAGYPVGPVSVTRLGGRLSLRLPANAMYVIVE
jgi:hypothetical protein